MSLIVVFVVSATALTSLAAPPPDIAAGVAAYERGDFVAALTILKPFAYEGEAAPTELFASRTAWAETYLAQMYRRGEGTTPDWALSCALFTNVWGYTRRGGPSSVQPLPFVEEGIKEVCLPDSQEEVVALRSACFLDGVSRREFVLEGGPSIVVDRRGFHLDLADDHHDVSLSMTCNQVMVALTEASVSIPDGSSNRRVHFLELFKWVSFHNPSNGQIVRELHWIVYIVRGAALAVATDQIVLTAINGSYPSLVVPPGIRDAAVLRLTAAGDVEWLLKGPRRIRGVIAKP